MSNCQIPMDSYGDTISKLNDDNRRLRELVRDMWTCLKIMPSSWEDDKFHAKYFWDCMRELGV